MNGIVLRPEPLTHGVVLRDGLLQLEEEAVAAEATHTRLRMVLAAFSGSADQFLG